MPFALRFQPIVRTQSGRFEGLAAIAEAARGRKVDSPTSFKSLHNNCSERKDMFGWSILSSILNQCQEWVESGVQFECVSWKVGQSCLASGAFMANLDRALDNAELEPKALVLEVAETNLTGQFHEKILSNIQTAGKNGYRITLDDFGAGGTSFSLLRDVHCSAIKIARDFVKDLPVDWRTAVLLEGATEIAHSLGALAIADGVDTRAQFEAVRNLGCDSAQGYCIAEPVPGSCVANLMESWRGEGFFQH